MKRNVRVDVRRERAAVLVGTEEYQKLAEVLEYPLGLEPWYERQRLQGVFTGVGPKTVVSLMPG